MIPYRVGYGSTQYRYILQADIFADTQILVNADSNMADTDIQLANTDISILVKYIGYLLYGFDKTLCQL